MEGLENADLSSSEESSEEVSLESEGSEESSSEESAQQEEIQGEVENLQDKLQEAVEDGASKKEIQKMIREFELKVNGKIVKQSLDLNDPEAVKRELQKAYAFNEVSQEYATVRKQLNAKIAEWKNDPAQALRDLGVDDLEFSEKRINKEVEDLKKDPQQKAFEEAQKKIQEYEAKEKAAQARVEQEAMEKADQEAYSALKQEIQDALSEHPYIKPTELTERRVADMMAHYSVKFPDITAAQVIPMVENEMKAEFNDLLEALPEEYIEKFLGKNAIDKLAKKFTKPSPLAKKPATKVAPTTMSQVKVPTSQGAKQGEAAQIKPKRSFEEIMSSKNR
jgi:acylphosphatase